MLVLSSNPSYRIVCVKTMIRLKLLYPLPFYWSAYYCWMQQLISDPNWEVEANAIVLHH